MPRSAPNEADVHVRYAIQHKDGLFVGHRSSGQYRAGSRWDAGAKVSGNYGPFARARIWARESDAERFCSKNETVVPITCVVGQPFAVFTEAP